jgi:hypothetical protein
MSNGSVACILANTRRRGVTLCASVNRYGSEGSEEQAASIYAAEVGGVRRTLAAKLSAGQYGVKTHNAGISG